MELKNKMVQVEVKRKEESEKTQKERWAEMGYYPIFPLPAPK